MSRKQHAARQQSRQHDSVESGDVIGDDEDARPGGGETLNPANFRAEEQTQGGAHQEERQNPSATSGIRQQP